MSTYKPRSCHLIHKKTTQNLIPLPEPTLQEKGILPRLEPTLGKMNKNLTKQKYELGKIKDSY